MFVINDMSKHTIAIFERMYKNLPPLVPDVIKEEIGHALEHLKNIFSVTVNDAEDVVIAIGKKIWPYRKAFEEFFDFYQGKLGEKFILGKLPFPLKKRYQEFREHGATCHDLRLGGPLVFFNSDEREKLTQIFVEIDKEIHEHTRQLVLSTEQKKYEELVLNFQNIFDDIEKRLVSLRLMAEDEEEHPQVADEIRAQIRGFELGLCLLGPNTKYHELLNVDDYIAERRSTKAIYHF